MRRKVIEHGADRRGGRATEGAREQAYALRVAGSHWTLPIWRYGAGEACEGRVARQAERRGLRPRSARASNSLASNASSLTGSATSSSG